MGRNGWKAGRGKKSGPSFSSIDINTLPTFRKARQFGPSISGLYFAYGSNLSLAQMKKRVPGAEFVGVAWLEDHQLEFRSWSQRWGGGVATVSKSRGMVVWGALFQMRPQHFRAMDGYEGYPSKYGRKQVKVRNASGDYTEAYTYFLRGDEPAATPSTSYAQAIYSGYTEFELPVEKLMEAIVVAEKESAKLTRVFVYGSLLSGLSNWKQFLQGNPGAHLVGETTLPECYTMISFSAYPGVIETGETAVKGEVYEVDSATLQRLDRLEGNGHFYTRQIRKLADGSEAWVYLLPAAYLRDNMEIIKSGDWRTHFTLVSSRRALYFDAFAAGESDEQEDYFLSNDDLEEEDGYEEEMFEELGPEGDGTLAESERIRCESGPEVEEDGASFWNEPPYTLEDVELLRRATA